MKIIEKSGTSYSYGETKLGRGYDATRQFLKENKQITKEILGKIHSKLKEDATASKAPSTDETEETPEE
jgi:recombination protein RecA